MNRTVTITIDPTPEEMADAFAEFWGEQQSAFMNRLAELVAGWNGGGGPQWSSMVRGMTPQSRAMLDDMASFTKETDR